MWKREKFRKHDDLNPVDLMLKKAFPTGMRDGVDVTIRYVCKFEGFGTYETWCVGYQIEGKGKFAESQYLDTAVEKWLKLVDDASPRG